MDIALLRTFLEVAASGSFGTAADRLFVTQSAVSLRIQRLEDQLGKPLFTRSRAGAILTPEGRDFEPYAMSILRVWEEARQRVAIPEHFDSSLSIGAQHSLWPRLGFRLIDRLRAARPTLALRAEVGLPDRLTRFMVEGQVHLSLMYTPQLRPGLEARQVLHEELVLAASFAGADLETVAPYYAMIDWGPEFVQAHGVDLPGLSETGLTFALGALGAEFVLNRPAAAYLPARFIKPYLDAGRLHLVADAPRFPYPVWSVWREDLDPDLRGLAEQNLKEVAEAAQTASASVLEDLAEISADHLVEVLNGKVE